ncbi:hypothetical protein [Alkalihalobacillus sp. R86527]|uniref:hypothetical protein n=1 Tax=Alkalihalobacillus sp. R86527 TaxID=3093863 RepID=UPI0036703158
MYDIKTFVVFSLLTSFWLQLTAIDVEANYTNEQFENSLYDIGFKEVHKAVDDAEKFYRKKIELPVQFPPIRFTHIFGRFDDLEGDINDELEITYINKDATKNHYIISIKPSRYKLTLNPNLIDRTIPLKDGTSALLSNKKLGRFIVLFFEDEGWQYRLSLDSASPEKVSPDMLVDIANSLK